MVGGNLKTSEPIFFVCGTPTDRYGFECKVLDGQRLPGQPGKYLDISRSEKFPQRGVATHCIRREETEEGDTAIYAEYRWIHPNDTEHNRGAFIAVGCWVSAPLTPFQAMKALHRIEQLHNDLAANLSAKNHAFLPDFRLNAYAAPACNELDHAQLAELLCRAADGKGVFERQYGIISKSTEEVQRGALARYLVKPGEGREGGDATAGNDKNRQEYLQEVMQDLMSEVPQSRQMIGALLKLEEKRGVIIRALATSQSQAIQNRSRDERRSSTQSRSNPIAQRAVDDAYNLGRTISTRDIVFSAVGITLGVAMTIAVISLI